MMFRRELFRRVTGLLLLGSADLLWQREAANARDSDVGGTLGAIVDHLVPAADLPGAVALGIDRQILAAADGDPAFSALLLGGIRWLDAAAARDFRALNFRDLAAAEQRSLLEQAERNGNSDGASLFASLRQRTMLLYYAHPRIVAAFRYAGPPQPDGFPDFEQPPREH